MDTLLRRRQMMIGDGPQFHTWLVFDGTAQVQTDIMLPTNGSVRVACGYETVKGQQGIFGAYNGTKFVFGIWLSSQTTSTQRKLSSRYCNTSGAVDVPEINFTTDYFLSFITPNKWGYWSHSWATKKGTLVPDSGIIIGNPAGGQNFTGRIATLSIYDSSAQNAGSWEELGGYTPAYTLRPCLYRREAGLWCVETDTFYGNTAGAGHLTVAD